MKLVIPQCPYVGIYAYALHVDVCLHVYICVYVYVEVDGHIMEKAFHHDLYPLYLNEDESFDYDNVILQFRSSWSVIAPYMCVKPFSCFVLFCFVLF